MIHAMAIGVETMSRIFFRPWIIQIFALSGSLIFAPDTAIASDSVDKTQPTSAENLVLDDSTAPETFITVPATSDTVGRTTVFTGYSIDVGGSGIGEVRIAIRDVATELWFDFTRKTFGQISDSSGNKVGIRNAELSDATDSYANWSLTVTLPDGEYQFFALAVDNANNSQYSGKGVWPVSVPFSVK